MLHVGQVTSVIKQAHIIIIIMHSASLTHTAYIIKLHQLYLSKSSF